MVAMRLELWGIKYLILARKELSNYIEGRALKTKITKVVCRFILKDIFNKYSRIRRIKANQGELDIIKCRNHFQIYDIKLKLKTTYNHDANI